MVKEYYEKICAGEDIRANLISLREELKDEGTLREFAYLLGGDFSKLCGLLQHEDPKVRKNAALVLGKMESEDLLPILFDAYQKEETLFIRADYLKAISELDYRPIAQRLEEQLSKLRDLAGQMENASRWSGEEVPPRCASEAERAGQMENASRWSGTENRKHVSEEIRILQAMVLRCRGIRHHRFSGEKVKADMILLTNRRHREATAEQIQKGKITMLAGGIRLEGASLKDVRSIRTYTELLFPLKTQPLMVEKPEQCGVMLTGPVLSLVEQLYNGSGAFLFRIELKGEGLGAKKGIYLRKISDALERESNARLINSVTDYEVEIRLILRKNDTYAAMLKPSVAFDGRFSYRKEIVASSISPVNAALTAYLARPWLKENAQILDPFCGVGTMLIERNYVIKAGTMYGLDIFGEAIAKARRNTQRAGLTVNYINRDFFTFRHEYLFDEVITDMPQTAGDGTRGALRSLYHDFFGTVGNLLKEEAVLVLYTAEPNYVIESVRERPEYRIEKQFLLNEKNHTTVFVILR